jgi:hypothetical protein
MSWVARTALTNSGAWQDDQINCFDHLDHLDETKDLAAQVIKLVDHLRGAEGDFSVCVGATVSQLSRGGTAESSPGRTRISCVAWWNQGTSSRLTRGHGGVRIKISAGGDFTGRENSHDEWHGLPVPACRGSRAVRHRPDGNRAVGCRTLCRRIVSDGQQLFMRSL